MSLKDTWVDKKNNEDYVVAEDINSIADAVITIEDEISGGIDNTPLIVRLTGNYDTGFTADKTFAEITAAVEKGKNVLASVTVEGAPHILALSSVTADENAMFAETIVTQFEGHTDYDTSYVFLYSDDTIAVDIGSMSAPTPITVVIEGTEGNYTASKTFKQLHNIISTHDNAAVVAMIETDPACCFSLASVTATQISFTCARSKDGKISIGTVTISNTDEIAHSSVDDIAISIVSVSESTQDGGNNTVTFSDGTTLTVKNGSKGSQGIQGAKGEKGDKGDKGETGAAGTAGIDGKTPIRGTDYWTEADKQEIVTETTAIDKSYIDDELAKRAQVAPEFVNSIDECTDTSKLYVLPDGYIYAWMFYEGETTRIVPISTEYNDNYRISASTGNLSSSTGATTTGFVDVQRYNYPLTVELSGIEWGASSVDSRRAFAGYDDQKVFINAKYTIIPKESERIQITGEPTEVKIVIQDNIFGSATPSYFRFGGTGSGQNARIQISYTDTISEYIWRNTGVSFIGSEYETRLAAVEAETEELREDVDALLGSAAIPDYVRTEAERVSDEVLRLRTADCFTIAALSDTHTTGEDTSSEGVSHACRAIREICSNSRLDLIAFLGDAMRDKFDTNNENGFIFLRKELYDIPQTPMIQCQGNHDELASDTTAEAQQKYWAYIGANNADTVTDYHHRYRNYGYKDFHDTRIRVIYVNTADVSDYDVAADCYVSADQAQWLCNEALDLGGVVEPSTWGVIVLSHHPLNWEEGGNIPILLTIFDAYKGRSSGSFAVGTQNISYDFGSAEAELLCHIHGHLHNYRVDKLGTHSITSVTVPNACYGRSNEYGTAYGDEIAQKYGDTDAEGNQRKFDKKLKTAEDTSFNVVVVARGTQKLYCLNYGAGIDREVYYGTKNLIPQSTEFGSTALYNGKGYKTNTYYSTSSSTVTDNAGGTSGKTFTTGLIAPKAGARVRLENCWIDPTATAETYGVAADKLNCVWQLANSTGSNTWANMVTSIATDIVYDGNKIVGWTYAALVSSLSMKGIAFTLASNNPMNAVMYIEE